MGYYPSTSSTWAGLNTTHTQPENTTTSQSTSQSSSQPARKVLRVYNPQTHKLVPISTDQEANTTDIAEPTRSHTPAQVTLKSVNEDISQASRDKTDTLAEATLSPAPESAEEAPYGFTYGGVSSFPNQWSWEMNKKTTQPRGQEPELETKEAVSESDLSLREVAERSASFIGVDTVTAPSQQSHKDESPSESDAASVFSHPDRDRSAVALRSRGMIQLQLAVQRAANTIAHAAARERATVPSASQATSQASSIQEPGRNQTVSPFLVPTASGNDMPPVVRTPAYDPRAVTGTEEADSPGGHVQPVNKVDTTQLKTFTNPASVVTAHDFVPQAPLTAIKGSSLPRSTIMHTKVVARPPPISPIKVAVPLPAVVRTKTPVSTAPVTQAKAVAPEVAFTEVLASPAPPVAPSVPARRLAILAPGRLSLRQPDSTYSVLSTLPSRRIAPIRSRPSRPTGIQPSLLETQTKVPATEASNTKPVVEPGQSGPATLKPQRVPWNTVAELSGSTPSSAPKPRPSSMSGYPQFDASTRAAEPGRPRNNQEMTRYLAKLDRDFYSSAPLFGRNMHQVVEEVHVRHVNAIYLDSKLGISRQEYDERCNIYASLSKSYFARSPYADMTIQEVLDMDKGKLAEPFLTMLFRTLLLFRAEEGLPPSQRTWRSHFFTNLHPAIQQIPEITLQAETTDEEPEQNGHDEDEGAEDEEEIEDDEEAEVWEQEGQLLDAPHKKKASRRRMRKDIRKKKQLLGYAC
ncbi:hypothetical protein DL546_003618 [Coniochaeta pulveracea]|uniref:Uncharacterized protein n=1 Tax=Coniochaeta pulveracea TaxID=177199 RepID=A0A420Y8S9_9PEZI|nr:hypothetical protein DL546_003618 [Coniochaeta pulveracea]